MELTQPTTPRNHVRPGYCCHCGNEKVFGANADTSKYRRVSFLLKSDGDRQPTTTFALCVNCVEGGITDEMVSDLKDQALDGWWHGLHGRAYRLGEDGWALCQVAEPMRRSFLENQWEWYVSLIDGFRLDPSSPIQTYEEVDQAEGVLI